MVFIPLNLPPASLSITRSSGIVSVRCLIRNKKVVLTPEEWVRQHVLHYMMTDLMYPKGLLAVEFPLKYNGSLKRCDILVIDAEGNPLLIVECKAPEVKLTHETFFQVSKYDNTLNASYLLMTNGLTHLFIQKLQKQKGMVYGQHILSWKEITQPE